jgi:hypothetical protein
MKTFSEIYLVSDKLETILPELVTDAEAMLGATFPLGYLEYLTELGTGMFCDYLYIYPPTKVVGELAAYREIFQESCDLWVQETQPQISREEFGKMIVLGHTMDMDKLAFHPENPSRIIAIPYSHDVIYQVGASLYQSLEWFRDFCVSPETDFKWFDSGVDHRYIRMEREQLRDLTGEFIKFTQELGLSVIPLVSGTRTWIFIRDLNGYLAVDSSPHDPKTRLTIVYDRYEAVVIDRIQAFFQEKGFEIRQRGEKTK